MKIQELPLTGEKGLAGAVAANLATVHQQLFLSWQMDRSEQVPAVQNLLTDLDVPQTTNGLTVQFMLPLAALPVLQKWSRQLFGDQQLNGSLQVVYEQHRQIWQAGRFTFDVTSKPLIYAILNITPDSFYDGGEYYHQQQWQQQIERLIHDGADIIEVGGQTTRPGGFHEISPEEEKRRILPAINFLHQRYPQVAIAVDTYKLPVMKAALDAGVDIINDVEAFNTEDKQTLLAQSSAGLVTMHSSRDREYDHLTAEMHRFFERNLADLQQAGIDLKRVVIDQGIGYSKVADGNQDSAMMRNIDQFNDFQRPILVAISRKGFGQKLLGLAKKDRLPVTLVAEAYMYLHGGRVLRVHDVAETHQLIVMLEAINHGYWNRDLNQESQDGKTNEHD